MRLKLNLIINIQVLQITWKIKWHCLILLHNQWQQWQHHHQKIEISDYWQIQNSSIYEMVVTLLDKGICWWQMHFLMQATIARPLDQVVF